VLYDNGFLYDGEAPLMRRMQATAAAAAAADA
jgi:hypothetical protein